MTEKLITKDDFIELRESVEAMSVLVMTNKIELENEIKELQKIVSEQDVVIRDHSKAISQHNESLKVMLEIIDNLVDNR